MKHLKPGLLVSYFERRPGGVEIGRWRKAKVMGLTDQRVRIEVVNPKQGERKVRTVAFENVELGWDSAERYQ